MESSPRFSEAALTALLVLQLVMLAALYAGVAPHPPARVAPFAIAPFLAAAMATAAAALIVGPERGRLGKGLALSAAAMALVSFGPQKYLDPELAAIWPAVVAGQVAVATILVRIFGRPAGRGERSGI